MRKQRLAAGLGNWYQVGREISHITELPNSHSLRDIDKGLTHIPQLSLQKPDPHQMKTADQNHVDPS